MMQVEFAAVIVTYNPDVNHVCDTIKNLVEQGFEVIVIDNGSDNVRILEEGISKSAHLVQFETNQGIAAALNKGMEHARTRGIEWVLSLDQDSTVAPNLYSAYQSYIDLPDAGALCPLILRVGDTRRNEMHEQQTGYANEVIDRCPTTGFFLNTTAWQIVGGYDDDFFIDYVDYDMCARLLISGFRIYRINSTYVTQELGKINQNRFIYKLGEILGWKKLQNFSVTYGHSPKRNYYYVRNSLIFIDRYKTSLNVNRDRNLLVKWEIKKLLLERYRLQQAKSIIRGAADYRAYRDGSRCDNH